MLPPVIATPTRLSRKRVRIGQQRRDAGGTGTFGHRLGAFDQQSDRLLDRAFRHHQHVGHPAGARCSSGSSPMSRTAMPSAMVGPPTETVSPASRCAIAA